MFVLLKLANGCQKIIVDELNDITKGKEAHGMIFVKDVSDAYEIGTKVSGEAALSPAKT